MSWTSLLLLSFIVLCLNSCQTFTIVPYNIWWSQIIWCLLFYFCPSPIPHPHVTSQCANFRWKCCVFRFL